MIDVEEMVLVGVNAALAKKAQGLVILKVKETASFADYFIICSGSSHRQVQAIAEAVEQGFKAVKILPLGIEGARTAQWILMDYGDVIVHVFYEPVRTFYDIERLWSDVPTMAVDDEVVALTSLEDLA